MKTVLNVKTDVQVKEDAQNLARHIGVPLSTIVNAYLKEFIATGEVRLTREPQLRPAVQKRIIESVREAGNGKNISKTFTSVAEIQKYLKR